MGCGCGGASGYTPGTGEVATTRAVSRYRHEAPDGTITEVASLAEARELRRAQGGLLRQVRAVVAV